MDLKLFEDLIALAKERSFVRAAETRHITHPAFGRRIRALETWAGTPLVGRSRSPVQLTEAGTALLNHAVSTLDGLRHAREQLRTRHDQIGGEVLRLGTGRTLARTLVADWLVEMSKPRRPLHGQRVEVLTRSMSEMAVMIERGDVDIVCGYEHAAMSVKLSTQRFQHITLASDKLVPVSRADAHGRAQHGMNNGPLIVYSDSLSLGGLLFEHLRRSGIDLATRARYVCDSADAVQEFALKGLGIAWLPLSMVAADCKRKVLVLLGGRSDEIHFEVRLYRARARRSRLVEALWLATNR